MGEGRFKLLPVDVQIQRAHSEAWTTYSWSVRAIVLYTNENRKAIDETGQKSTIYILFTQRFLFIFYFLLFEFYRFMSFLNSRPTR